MCTTGVITCNSIIPFEVEACNYSGKDSRQRGGQDVMVGSDKARSMKITPYLLYLNATYASHMLQ